MAFPDDNQKHDFNPGGKEIHAKEFHVHGNFIFSQPVGQPSPPLKTTPEERRQLLLLLQTVRQFWIEGVLKDSVHHEAMLALEMEDRADAVEHPWERVMALPNQPGKTLPPGKSITSVYNEVSRFLLILGEPGSGKTTTLLELARDLLESAGKNEGEAIPVIFNLSSWQAGQSLQEWLLVELRTKYQVSEKVGRTWLEGNLLLPLLDGLDEVKTENQPGCVAAINQFIDAGGLSGLAVCSRLKEYETLKVHLRLNGAVCLLPLTPEQVDDYLARAGIKLKALAEAVKTDPDFRELATSPLMLNIMSLAYESASYGDLARATSNKELRDLIFSAYVEKTLRRKGKDGLAYPEGKIRRLLSCLAKKMSGLSISIFMIDELQPDWLDSTKERNVYGAISGIILLGFCSLVFTPLGAYLAGIIGFFYAAAIAILSPKRKIKVIGSLNISIRRIMLGLQKRVKLILVFLLIVCFSMWLLKLPFLKAFGLFSVYVAFLFHSIFEDIIDEHQIAKSIVSPNQRIHLSLRSALFACLTFLLIITMMISVIELTPVDWKNSFNFSLILGVSLLLIGGGSPVLQHYSLRLILFFKGRAPLNYVKFLDHCAKLILLKKVGGGYIFIHRMLLEYFAGLENSETAQKKNS